MLMKLFGQGMGTLIRLIPTKPQAHYHYKVGGLIYDTMLATDKDGNIVPHVAKSWSSSSDGKVYTFELNDGIECHDGTALDANDIKYTCVEYCSDAIGKARKIIKARTVWQSILEAQVQPVHTVNRVHAI